MSTPAPVEIQKGNYSNCCTLLLCLVGGVLLIAGASLPQRRDSFNGNSYEIYFYQDKFVSSSGVSTFFETSPCIESPYMAAMVISILGGAMAILLGVPLTYCIAKWRGTPSRFIRPAVIGVAGVFGLIGAIISAATTKCDGFDFSDEFKLYVGFGLLIAGAVILLLSSAMSFLQPVLCPYNPNLVVGDNEETIPAQHGTTATHQGTYNYAAQQQQQQQQRHGAFASGNNHYNNNSNNTTGYGGGHQQQQGVPVMGFAMNEQPSTNHQVPPYGGGGLYGGGGGAPIYGNNGNNEGGGIY